jgi:hypothetical protein
VANVTEYGLFDALKNRELDPNMLIGSVNTDLLVSMIRYDAAAHNFDINTALRWFVEDVGEKFQFAVDQMAAVRNQPVDEFGRSLPIRPAPPYTIQIPIQGSGNAWGANFIAMRQMTARTLAKTLAAMYRGDWFWVRDHILGALFANASYSMQDFYQANGTLTVRGMANSDSTTYFKTSTGLLATDTHYLAQAAAIADGTNPFPAIRLKLVDRPVNSGDVVAFIATSLVATTAALATFNSALLDARMTPAITNDRLTGPLNLPPLPPGATAKGMLDDGTIIVEWPALPADYIVAVTTDGDRPLGRRQFAEADLQGFGPRSDRTDFPYSETQWQRFEGYGGRNRVGAVIQRIGNASYAVPTNYGEPMQ